MISEIDAPYTYLYQLEKRMRQIVGALALPCPLEYFDVSPRLLKLVLYQLEKRMRQIVGALALPCPLEYFDVSPRLFELVLDFSIIKSDSYIYTKCNYIGDTLIYSKRARQCLAPTERIFHHI